MSIERLKAALADRYAIERELGSGGMATVYLATDLKHDRQVAIKVLRPELAATLGAERFLREVQVTANLQHPHILPLFDSGEAEGLLYYVMPYVEGESLRTRLDREGELPVPEAVRVLKEVVDALAAAHAQGLVHRDVKPGNVMLAGRHAMVVDFGVAKALSEAAGAEGLTTAGLAVGTVSYMAPEQAEGSAHIDHRADLYAVGVMGYELLTGRTPFEGRTPQQILMAQVMETPRPVTELRQAVPAGLSAVLARCLERKPADRWQTAEELLAQLDTFVTTGEGVTPLQPLAVEAGRPGAVRRWLPAAAVMGLAALGAALFLGGESTGADASRATAGAGGLAADASVLRLVVAPLQNVSGDPSWDSWSTIAIEEISRAVERTGVVNVVPWTAVLDVIRTRGDTATVATLASETGATYAVAGTIARAGPEVRFAALIQDAGGGGLSTRIEPVTGPPDSVTALIGEVGDRVAAALVAQLDPDLPAWTASERLAPSPEVLEHYTASLDLFCHEAFEESIAIGDRALALAPDYVPQLMMNAYAYGNLGRGDARDSVLALMEPLRDQMTSAERAEMDLVTAWRDDDEARALQVAGLTYLMYGRPEEALERLLAVDREDACVSNWPSWWRGTAGALHATGRLEEALAIVREGLQRIPTDEWLLRREIRFLAALGEGEAFDSLFAVLPPTEWPEGGWDRILWTGGAAGEAAVHGQDALATVLYQRVIDWVESQPADELERNHHAWRALASHATGRSVKADTILARLAAETESPLRPNWWNYVQGERGAVLADIGRTEEARALSELIATRASAADTAAWVTHTRFVARARIAAALGDRDAAVELVRQALEARFVGQSDFHSEPRWRDLWGYPPWDALWSGR